MTLTLLTDHHLEFLGLKGGCTGSSESTHVKIPHCWKSHVVAHIMFPAVCETETECGGVLLEPSGWISPPDRDGDGQYDNLEDCEWNITVAEGYVVVLDIMEMDLEEQARCPYDYLRVSRFLFFCVWRFRVLQPCKYQPCKSVIHELKFGDKAAIYI